MFMLRSWQRGKDKKLQEIMGISDGTRMLRRRDGVSGGTC